MAGTLSLRIKGLITNPNTLDPNISDGALAVADNVVIDKDNLAETRRGFSKFGLPVDLGLNNYEGTISTLFNYQNKLIAHYDTKLAIQPELSSSPWVEYTGDFYAPDSGFKIRSLESNKNLYVNTQSGIYKLSSTDGDFEKAGIARALDGFAVVNGTSGWFPDSSAVAYRVLWGKYDDNNNLILGAPSSRIVVGNASGDPTVVVLTILIPNGITPSHFYQIYRSNTTEALLDEPSDEMQLVIEGKLDQSTIDSGEMEITDEVSADLRGATLYTSPSQQGIENSNEPPPFAKDMCIYKGSTIYANTKTKHTLGLKLIGVGDNAFEVGDTVTINSIVYTGASAENINNNEFYVSVSESPATAIDETALSLIRVLNSSDDNTEIYAYYLSGFDDVPGKLLFQKIELDDDPFYAVSSKGEAFSPTLPVSGQTVDNTSENEVKPNRIFFSKQQQPEAVPLANYFDIGSSNQAIRRIIGLRDSVFIFKDDGVFRLSGTTSANFTITLFDATVKLLAPESCVAFNNTVFAMTNQGVVSVSDSGVAVVSRNIEQSLLKLIQYPNFNNSTFGVAYESERKYILFCINSTNQTYPTQAYVYNSFTNAWTRWVYDASCGVINSYDDKLYLGSKYNGLTQAQIFRELKSFSLEDFVDDNWEINITEVISQTKLRLSTARFAVVGYFIRQLILSTGKHNLGKITAIDEDNEIITIENFDELNWNTNPQNGASIYKPIVSRIKWVANHAGNPGIQKQFRESTLFFHQHTSSTINIGYETSFQPGYEYTQEVTLNTGLWGDFNWGLIPYNGLDDTFSQPIRVGIPRNKQRCMWISFSIEGSNAFSSFSLAGISTAFEVIGERYSFKPGAR